MVSGEAEVLVEGRSYYLSPLDGVHFPSGTAHSIVNRAANRKLVAHWAFATAHPARQLIRNGFDRAAKSSDVVALQTPEYVVRFSRPNLTSWLGMPFLLISLAAGLARSAFAEDTHCLPRARHCLATSIAVTSRSQSFG